MKRSNVPITLREIEVLCQLAAGKRPVEIAAESYRSYHTVMNQIKTAKAKLGARTLVQTVVIAERLRLLDGPHG